MLATLKKTFVSLVSKCSMFPSYTAPAWTVSKRYESGYDPYPDYKTPSPYKERRGIRRVYQNKLFSGGLLPRPEGDWEDKRLPMPIWDPKKKDAWTTKKALFGQNDYIDILGDGTVHPWELIRAPPWLKGFKGNEMQRLTRQMSLQGEFLRDTFPTKYNNIKKQIFFLYKRLNKNRRSSHWGGGRRRFSRIDKPKP